MRHIESPDSIRGIGSTVPSHRLLAFTFSASVVAGLAILWLPAYVTIAVILSAVLLSWATLTTGLSTPFLLFATYYVLVMAGSRDFAHVGFRVANIPIYISEIALFAVVVTLIPRIGVQAQSLKKLFPPGLLAYLGLGFIALLRGLPDYGIEAIRDSAICYYAICYPLTIYLTSRARFFRTFLYVLVASWVAATFMVVYRYAMGIGEVLYLHDVVRYGSGSQAIGVASGAGVAFAAWLDPRRFKGRAFLYVVGIVQVIAGVFLIQHRSLFLAFIAVGLLVIVYCADRRRSLVLLLGCVALIIMLSPLVFTLDGVGLPLIVEHTLDRIRSVGDPYGDGSTEWRLFAWKQAIEEGMENPIFGVGFGTPFILPVEYKTEYDVDPHNSYVAIFYRLGILGVAAFLALWLPVLAASYRAARRDPSRRFRIAFALSCHVAVAFFALFNVVLEGPYMGIPFWCSLGVLRQAIDTDGDWPEVSEVQGGNP